MFASLQDEFRARLSGRNLEPDEHAILVSICEQKLFFVRGPCLLASFVVSTSRLPPSCREDSGGTPTGLHRVAGKFGDGLSPGTVLVGRVAMPYRYSEDPTNPDNREGRVTSRILRLAGLEPGFNQGPGCDSFARYIYIHGTNHEENLGRPNSAGCVNMRNTDIIELYPQVPSDTLVFISLS